MKRHPILNYRLIMIPGVLVVLLAASTVWAVAMTGGVINACVLKDGTLL